MTRRKKPSASCERTVEDELRSVAIAPTLKRHRKRDSMPEETIATARQEPMTPMVETVQDLLAGRKQVEEMNARQINARQDAEAESARQIMAIATEAAALLLGPVPE
jgi:uncharacterized Zn finger protein (UPF0148 family)